MGSLIMIMKMAVYISILTIVLSQLVIFTLQEDCSEYYEYFCPETNECQSRARACDGKCPSGRRYCPRYKIDDYIGDGQGSCVEVDEPCGDQCINGRYFCLASNSCLQSMDSCECPEEKWPAEDCGQVEKCSLFANETLPEDLSRCAILVSKRYGGSKHTLMRGGACHPSYVYCQETQTCVPLLYSACGYSDWLAGFQLRECVQFTGDLGIKKCVEEYLNRE